LLTFYPCSIRKTSLTRLVLGWTHQPLVPHELGFSWTWTRWIKGCPSCSLNVPSPSRSILLHMFWTNPFQCFFKFLCPSSCDWPNWHLQWVVGMITLGVGLIRIKSTHFIKSYCFCTSMQKQTSRPQNMHKGWIVGPLKSKSTKIPSLIKVIVFARVGKNISWAPKYARGWLVGPLKHKINNTKLPTYLFWKKYIVFSHGLQKHTLRPQNMPEVDRQVLKITNYQNNPSRKSNSFHMGMQKYSWRPQKKP